MSIDLTSYRAIEIGNFVTISAPADTFRFSDMNRAVTYNGYTYTNLGSLLTITDFSSELRVVEQEVSLGISGIPGTNITDFLDSDIKGSTIEIARGYYDPVTGGEIGSGDRTKFRGYVRNWSMTEEWDSVNRTASFLITLVCNNQISQILQQVSGRRTNDSDQQELYPGDLSMSRVATITRANFNFGKPAQGENQ